MREILLSESEPEDTEPWKKFLIIVPATSRPASSRCLGWGNEKATKPGAKKTGAGKKKDQVGMNPIEIKKERRVRKIIVV